MIILVAVTLALALGVYAYFQSQASTIQRDRALVLLVNQTASSIDANIVSWVSDTSASPTIACYYVDIINIGDEPILFHLTVLPVEEDANGFYQPTENLRLIPVDQQTGDYNLYFYRLEDYNADGVLETLGVDGATSVYNGVLDCGTLRADPTLLNSSLTVDPIPASEIHLTLTRATLSDLAPVVAGVNPIFPLPVLPVYLNPGERVTLLVHVRIDDNTLANELLPVPYELKLTVLREFEGDYYLSIAFDLPG